MYMYFKPWRCSEYDRVQFTRYAWFTYRPVTGTLICTFCTCTLYMSSICWFRFMSYHSCDGDYSEKRFVIFIFSLFSICRGFPKTSEIRQLGCLRVGGPPGYSRIGSGAVGRRLIVLQRGTSRRGCSRPAATWKASCYITLTHLPERQLAVTVTARQYAVSGQIIRNRLRPTPNQSGHAARTLVRSDNDPTSPCCQTVMGTTSFELEKGWLEPSFVHRWISFTVSHADGTLRVYRRKNERFADCCIVEKNRFGRGGVMVWVGSWETGRHIWLLYRATLMHNVMLQTFLIYMPYHLFVSMVLV